jgi:hypothetical protein
MMRGAGLAAISAGRVLSKHFYFVFGSIQTQRGDFENFMNDTENPREIRANEILEKETAEPVVRKGEGFTVSEIEPETGYLTESTVWRNPQGKVVCNCPDYFSISQQNPHFRCEHILATKKFLRGSF